jgi:hypothetical protein
MDLLVSTLWIGPRPVASARYTRHFTYPQSGADQNSLLCATGLAALVAGAAAGQPVAPAPRTPWDVIRTSPVHTILKALIEANNLVSAVDKTGIIVMAPTNDQLQPVIDRGVPATAPWVVQVVAHHVITVSSLNSGNLPTLNGNIVNKGTSSQ